MARIENILRISQTVTIVIGLLISIAFYVQIIEGPWSLFVAKQEVRVSANDQINSFVRSALENYLGGVVMLFFWGLMLGFGCFLPFALYTVLGWRFSSLKSFL